MWTCLQNKGNNDIQLLHPSVTDQWSAFPERFLDPESHDKNLKPKFTCRSFHLFFIQTKFPFMQTFMKKKSFEILP